MVRFFEDRLAVHEQLQAAFEEEQQGVRAHQQVLLAKFKDSKVPHRMTAEEMKEKVQARRYVAKKGEMISSMGGGFQRPQSAPSSRRVLEVVGVFFSLTFVLACPFPPLVWTLELPCVSLMTLDVCIFAVGLSSRATGAAAASSC